MLRQAIVASAILMGGLSIAALVAAQDYPDTGLERPEVAEGRLERMSDRPAKLVPVPSSAAAPSAAGGEVMRLGENPPSDPLQKLLRLRERMEKQDEDAPVVLTAGNWGAGRKFRGVHNRSKHNAAQAGEPTLADPDSAQPLEPETADPRFGEDSPHDSGPLQRQQSSRRLSSPSHAQPAAPEAAGQPDRSDSQGDEPQEFSRGDAPARMSPTAARSIDPLDGARPIGRSGEGQTHAPTTLQEKLGTLRQSSRRSYSKPPADPVDLYGSASQPEPPGDARGFEPRDAALEPEVQAEPSSEAGPLEPVRSARSSRATTQQAPAEPVEEERLLLDLEGPQITASALGPKKIVVGRQAEYTVRIHNEGHVEANDMVVSVSLPPWVDVVETNPTTGDTRLAEKTDTTQPLQWRIMRLAAQGSESLTLHIIPRKSHPLNLSVRWTYAHAGSQARVEVEEPMLQMVISGPNEAVFGQTKLYNLTVSNPGSGDAENVVVTLVPLGGKQDSAATTSLGRLKQGETKTIQIELTAGKAGTLLVRAHAEADGGIRAEASKEVVVRRASLRLKVEGPPAQYAGNNATYKLRVSNPGNAGADEVSVTVFLPEGAQLAPSSESNLWVEQQGRVRWDVGQLAPGQEQVQELVCVLNTPGDNQLRVTAQDKTDLATSTGCTTSVIARADLKLNVVDPDGPVPVGEVATYQVRIRNRGTKSAEDIEVVTFFSDGIEPVAVIGAPHELGRGQVIFKTIGELAADGELVLQIKARADRPGDHVFRTEVLCRSLGTRLAAEETTHFYGKELAAPPKRTSAPQSTAALPRPHAPAPIETAKPE